MNVLCLKNCKANVLCSQINKVVFFNSHSSKSMPELERHWRALSSPHIITTMKLSQTKLCSLRQFLCHSPLSLQIKKKKKKQKMTASKHKTWSSGALVLFLPGKLLPSLEACCCTLPELLTHLPEWSSLLPAAGLGLPDATTACLFPYQSPVRVLTP